MGNNAVEEAPAASGAVHWKRNLLVVWVSQLLSLAGFAAVMPFIPVYFRDHFGLVDMRERGLWVTVFNFSGMLTFCLAQPMWGKLADRFGYKAMLLRANYVTGVLFPFLALAPNIGIMIIVRLLVSSFSGTTAAAQTLIVDGTPEKHQGFALGLLSTALWSGNMVGFVLGGIMVSQLGFMWAFGLCGAMYLVGGALVHVFVDEIQPDARRPMSGCPQPLPTPEDDSTDVSPPSFASVRTRAAARTADAGGAGGAAGGEGGRRGFGGFPAGIGLLLGIFAMMGAARRLDEPYIAMLVEFVHGPEDTALYTGWISAAAAVGGILSGALIGRLCDRYSPMKVAGAALLLSAAAMFLHAEATGLFYLGAVRFVCFFAAGGLEPAFQAMLARASPPDRRGVLFGLASSVRMAGILAGTLLGGGVLYMCELPALFRVGAGMYLLMLPYLVLVARGGRAAKENGGDASP